MLTADIMSLYLFNQNDNPVVATREAIGVDLGLKNFTITSVGSKYWLGDLSVLCSLLDK